MWEETPRALQSVDYMKMEHIVEELTLGASPFPR
jgi:hypothetical protein